MKKHYGSKECICEEHDFLNPINSYINFELGPLVPKKGKNMTNVQVNEVADGVVEILDADGNPTGEFRRVGEATPEEATIFTTAEDGDHEVTVH